MTLFLYDTQTETLLPYPRADDAPVVGLDPRYAILRLLQDEQPAYDPQTQRLDSTQVIDLEAGEVRRGWVVVTLPPPVPVPDWLGFAGWLYVFPPIAAAMDAARLSTEPQGEPATTGLPTALDEARLRQNYPAFSLTWGLFLQASGMPVEALGAIVAKATECNLPAEFIAALQPDPQP